MPVRRRQTLLDPPARRGLDRVDAILLRDVMAVDVVEIAVPGLRRHRQGPAIGQFGVVADGPGDDRGVGDPDGVGVGDGDRQRERAGLLDPRDAGHLPVAVLGEEARGHRVGGTGRPAREDGGHPRPDGIPPDDGRVSDLHAGHVGDGVPVARRPAERYAQGPGPRLAQRRRRVRASQVLRFHDGLASWLSAAQAFLAVGGPGLPG